MAIIKKIIDWIKEIFRKIFKKNKRVKGKIKSNINKSINKRYLKGYGVFINDSSEVTLPIYLMVQEEERESIVRNLELIEEKIISLENNKINKSDAKRKIDKIINIVNGSEISFYQCNKIEESLNNFLMTPKFEIDTNLKIEKLDKDIYEILNNYDRNIKDKTLKEYKKINYVTLTTLLIDETREEIKKLEDDYHHHKYNKYYYEREIRRIKERINNLKKMHNSEKIKDEITKLKKEIFTKNKDKYDLLYNEEVFLNINKYCDDLLKKINRKVIDIKKIKQQNEKNELTKEEKKKEKDEKKEEKIKQDEINETLENILKRFYDMELARRILLLEKENIKIENNSDLFNYFNNAYYDFINGEKVKFNYDRNKEKTELIKLYNKLGIISSKLTKEEFLLEEHINYPMNELLEATINKKNELNNILKSKFNYKEEENEASILVDNKIDILKKKEEERNNDKSHILIKK